VRRVAVLGALVTALATYRSRRLAASEQRIGIGVPPLRRPLDVDTNGHSATPR
jgi:hypothetical protein